jgi:hypothetical protein
MSELRNLGGQHRLVGGCLVHCLGSCADLLARCVIGRESLKSWAKRHDFDWEQVRGVYVMLRHIRRAPSPARRAVILSLDHGLDDSDIAEMLYMEEADVAAARQNAAALRKSERIPEWAEYYAAEMSADDPPPEELYRRAAELRQTRVRTPTHRKHDFDVPRDAPRAPGIREYFWSRRHASFS